MKKNAKIARMVTPDHFCPWGIKTINLLRRRGFEIEDQHLVSEEANASFKKENDVTETPQIWIEGNHIGGYDELRKYLDLGPDPKEGDTYQPIIALFAVTALMAVSWTLREGFSVLRFAEVFIALSMCVLGILKLQNLQSFATGFVQYDLIARRYVPYSNVYPFIEAGGGILMLGAWLTWLAAPLVLIVSTIGALSVIKAVYLDKRDLNCACVGGGSRVPLGAISLTENLLMMAMSIWSITKLTIL